LLAFLLVPILALVYRASGGDVWASLFSETAGQAIGLSLSSTLISTSLAIVFGTPLAYVMARYQFRLKRFVDVLIDLPSIMPPAVAGLALLMTFGRRGIVGSYLEAAGIQIAFTQTAVVLAQLFISVPFYIRAATLGFAAIEPELEEAAALDGASGTQTFRYFVVPLSWTAMVSGAVTCWARALGEFGATIIFAGNFPGRTQTMPLAIYLGFEIDLELALTLSLILIVFASLSLFVVKYLLQRQQQG
jgi:molybdate transport system permease protein